MVAHSLKQALEARNDLTITPYTGGTDLMVWPKENAKYLHLHKVPELKKITEDKSNQDKTNENKTHIRFGAACTFTEVIAHPLTPKILKEACKQIGAPAIRNAGSIGGNIANGSAKADSALIFMATDSKLRLASAESERYLPIKDFYLGRKKLDIKPNELIVEILMPKDGLDNYYYVKVGARAALAISRVSFAGIADIKDGIIKNCATAFGAVSDVIIRPDEIDRMLIGKTIEEAKKLKNDYLAAMDEFIVPIKGRVGIEYRKDVCMHLLRDFFEKTILG